MKIESVAEALLEEAQKEAEEIKKKAKLEANEIVAREKQELAKRKKEELAAYERTVKKLMEEKIAAARLDAKKDVLKAKDEVAKEVLSMVYEKLLALKKDKTAYKKILTSFYKRCAEELAKEDLKSGNVILCAKEDVPLLKSIVSDRDSVKESAEIDGGIIVKSKEGVIIDLTFSTILKDRESEIKRVIYKKLFAQ